MFKVFNYGRIYGAGVSFAIKLLMQFNPGMSEKEARLKAKELYKSTKGYRITETIELKNDDENSNGGVAKQLEEVDEENQIVEKNPTVVTRRYWKDGSESEMFNKLEEIARSECPRTPVLDARITCTLEPQNVNDDVHESSICRIRFYD